MEIVRDCGHSTDVCDIYQSVKIVCQSIYHGTTKTFYFVCRQIDHFKFNHPGKRCQFCNEWKIGIHNDTLVHRTHLGKFCCGVCGLQSSLKIDAINHLREHGIFMAPAQPVADTQYENEQEYEDSRNLL